MATNDHYDARSDHYEEAFFYEKGEYHEWMVKSTVRYNARNVKFN
jgi:hypothetical protein